MRFFILFGLVAAVIGDLMFLNGEYTGMVGHGLSSFAEAIRGSGKSLWGA